MYGDNIGEKWRRGDKRENGWEEEIGEIRGWRIEKKR